MKSELEAKLGEEFPFMRMGKTVHEQIEEYGKMIATKSYIEVLESASGFGLRQISIRITGFYLIRSLSKYLIAKDNTLSKHLGYREAYNVI